MAMADHLFAPIDWARPWLNGLRELAHPALLADHWKTALNAQAAVAGLLNHRGLPLQFGEQAELPAGEAYESFISRTGRVPTRDNLHDFFNALAWLAYPASKATLNAIQATEILHRQNASLDHAFPARGVVRDRATIFDENAALLLTSDPGMAALLRDHAWEALLLERRDAFCKVGEVILFGHALIEKLVRPYKAITAHVWVVEVSDDFFGQPAAIKRHTVDRLLQDALTAGLLSIAATPLPVLGVPEWWPGQDAAFYADRQVFRAKRRHAGHAGHVGHAEGGAGQ